MSNFVEECNIIVEDVQVLLQENPEWIKRYDGYTKKIIANLEKIKSKKKLFNEWAPLYLYMTVSQLNSQMKFSLRYLGQEVAKLQVGKERIKISTDGFSTNNKRDFNCDIKLDDDWRSKNASDFRRFFKSYPERSKKSGKHNEEHRIESLLLTEFSEKKSKNKLLCNIQPVRFSNISRFQMPTPLKGSDINNLAYSGPNGGGIDILSRVGKGGAVKLCIMEVKDENTSKEPPSKTILQGLAYATFMRELLRSESGDKWWKIFGFNGKLPAQLELQVACVMPSTDMDDTSFAGIKIQVGNDVFSLQHIYYKEKNNKFIELTSSL